MGRSFDRVWAGVGLAAALHLLVAFSVVTIVLLGAASDDALGDAIARTGASFLFDIGFTQLTYVIPTIAVTTIARLPKLTGGLVIGAGATALVWAMTLGPLSFAIRGGRS